MTKTIKILRIFDRTGSYVDATGLDVVDFESAMASHAERNNGSRNANLRAAGTFLRVTRKKDGMPVSIACASIVRAEQYEEYVD